MLPVLELDDGTRIDESVAICRYFEELQPEPALMGNDGIHTDHIELWLAQPDALKKDFFTHRGLAFTDPLKGTDPTFLANATSYPTQGRWEEYGDDVCREP